MDHTNKEQGKTFLEQVKKHGTEGGRGAHTAVILEETVYGISGEMAASFRSPDCPEETCERQRANINELCKSEAWPPGKPVLVCDANGYCCNCHCL